jgi:Reverse transcriptase (RNA-dependent DNA polymerase)
MSDNFQPESLSWALTHVRRFGDTDIFPIPFEYEAIAHNWNSIGPHLQNVDFGDHKVSSDRRVMVIKPGGGFRAAVQLDPLDHLLYTAAVYEAAEMIEKARIPAKEQIACSYRVHLTPEGAFFPPNNGWNDFHSRSKQLAESATYSHLLLADISDFYNQLGQHRIQNALEMASVPTERSKNVERFLSQLTSKQSQGLPVGPLASIILAESCLIDVDNFLLRLKVSYTRYVDDFRIFCSSRKQAIEIRYELSDYLFAVHRLSLESSKSYIQYLQNFIKEELSDPEEIEEQAKLEKLTELLEAAQEERGGYWEEEIEEPSDEVLGQAEQESFIELFKRCVEHSPLNLGLARHLLRKAKQSRTVVLNNLVFKHLEALAPVMRDVMRYLATTIPKSQAASRGQQLLKFCSDSDLGNLPFVRMWILDLLTQRRDLCPADQALALAKESESNLGIRPSALLAALHNQIDWVRARKETWRNLAPWDRRAIVWSMSALPTGERKPFLSMVAEQGDPLDAAVAKYLLNK